MSLESMKKNVAGICLCIAIAIPSLFLGKAFPVVGGPVFAIVIGILIGNFIKDWKSVQVGIKFTSKKILQYAVILLGFGMNLTDILAKGKESLPIILSTIATSLIIAYVLCKLLKIPRKISVLVGVGSSICGGSAIAATAPVIDADDEEIAQAISVIFLFNIIAALIFPQLGELLGLTNKGFAIFAGTAVNDTSSVTAAASAWDGIHGTGVEVLNQATIVKLTRTLAIIPITLVLAFMEVRKAEKAGKESGASFSLKAIFPFFILYFVLASVITTVFSLQPSVTAPLKELSKFFIIMAMGAIGCHTDIVKLVKSGIKPIFMGLCCWIGIAIVSLVIQHSFHLW